MGKKTMDELIKKQDAINAIMRQETDAHYPSWYAKIIDRIPPVYKTKGKWVEVDIDLLSGYLYHGYCCSECNHIYEIKCNYCPNCGAYMKGNEL